MNEIHKVRIIGLVCLLVFFGSPLRGAEPAMVPVLVNVLEQAELSPREPGVLMAIDACEGRQVTEGDTLAQIDDTEERFRMATAKLQMEIAAKEAASEVALLDAQKSMAFAQAMYQRAREAVAEFAGSIPQTELERLRLDAERSELAVRQAKHDQEVAELERDLKRAEYEFATQQIERRKIVAPYDGMVVEVKGRRGEYVQPGDKIIRMIRLDHLRVEGFLNARAARRELKGRPVRLTVDVPGRSTMQYKGRLVFVSPEVDPVNDQVRLLADIENSPELTLRPGLRGTMTIESPATR